MPSPAARGFTDFVCSWTALGLAETHSVLDGAAVRRAAEGAVVLWPWEPEEAPKLLADPPLPLAGWFRDALSRRRTTPAAGFLTSHTQRPARPDRGALLVVGVVCGLVGVVVIALGSRAVSAYTHGIALTAALAGSRDRQLKELTAQDR